MRGRALKTTRGVTKNKIYEFVQLSSTEVVVQGEEGLRIKPRGHFEILED